MTTAPAQGTPEARRYTPDPCTRLSRAPRRPSPSFIRTKPTAMTTIRQEDLIQSVADALQFISYYHPRGLHPRPGGCLQAGGVPRRQGRHGPDPGQLADVRRGAPPHLPGHRHGGRLPQGRHGGPLRGELKPAGMVDEGGAPGLYAPGQPPARLHGLRPHRGPQEHRGQHPRGGPRGAGPRRDLSRSSSRPRAAGRRTRPASPSSTPATAWWTGSCAPSRPWAPAGARRGCSASASADRRRRPCSWPRRP